MEFLDQILGRPSYAFFASLAVTVALLPVSLFGAKWWSNSSSKRYKRRMFLRLKNVSAGIYRAKDNYAAYDAAYVLLRILLVMFLLLAWAALSVTLIGIGKDPEYERWRLAFEWIPTIIYVPFVVYLNTKMNI